VQEETIGANNRIKAVIIIAASIFITI